MYTTLEKKFSKSYQSGPLSFEYFLDGIKIITNSGFGGHISKRAEELSRLTACQSTLSINDTSVTKFKKSEMINKVFNFKRANLNVTKQITKSFSLILVVFEVKNA